MNPDTNTANALPVRKPRARGSVACRRCRRLRIKCQNTANAARLRESRPELSRDANRIVPCEACKMAGPYESETCTFPRRGEADVDREWRSRICNRVSQEENTPAAGDAEHAPEDVVEKTQSTTERNYERSHDLDNLAASHRDSSDLEQDDFPTKEEIIEACRVFTTSYFQLGFIPKTSFLERILKGEVSHFLLTCILCLSARFTSCLVERYGDGTQATERLMAAAHERVPREMYKTNLENIQSFFLLSIAEWGNGDRDQSSIHMGIAVRMAAMMKLHREETYQLPDDATNDQIIYAETARRTFWMIQSQDNLHSGFSSPLPFSCEDITALLPSGESDFSFGIVPAERAALPSTPPALTNPSLVDSPRRSLFATLVQSHSLWGQVARRACRPENALQGLSDEYLSMAAILKNFEEHLPVQHRWSSWSLKVWKDLGFELAYLSVVMMIRLGNILMRRMYLENIKASIDDSVEDDGSPSDFWKPVSEELFENVVELYQQIEASFTMRTRTEGYPAILVFPIYVCGSLSLNLWQCPQLCRNHADKAASILTQCLQIIDNLQHAWPMARRWREGLQQAATPLSAGPSPVSIRGMPSTPNVSSAWSCEARESPREQAPDLRESPNIADSTPRDPQQPTTLSGQAADALSFDIHALPNDLFDAEVTAFLQGDLHYGLLDEWNHTGFALP